MTVRAVLAAGLALLLAFVGVVLAQSSPRSAGSNYVPEVEETVKLKGKGRHCQRGETIPAEAAGLRLLVGTYGRPAPELTVAVTRANGARLTAGGRPGGGPEGRLTIALKRVDQTMPGARVCINVRGPGRTVLYGSAGRVRLEWVRGGEESWFAMLPTVAHRFALGRADVPGPLLLPLVCLLLLAAWLAAIRLVIREVDS